MKASLRILFCLLVFHTFSFAENSDLPAIKGIVNEWSNDHTIQSINNLNSLYAPNLLFYCKNLDKAHCIGIIQKALKTVPDFKQQIVSDIDVSYYENGVIKCDFTKQVYAKGKTRDYSSYLLLKKVNTEYLIVGEGDKITDANLHYHLNLGKQITPGASLFPISNTELIIVGGLLLVLILVIVVVRNKRNKPLVAIAGSPEVASNASDPIHAQPVSASIETVAASAPPPIENASFINQETAEKAKQALNTTLTQTKTFITKVFDSADFVDRKLYGKRMSFFLWFCIIVLFLAPAADWLLNLLFNISHDRLTFYSTFAFFLFVLTISLAFIGSWRDDSGNWSWKRAKSRLSTYVATIKDTYETTKTTTKDERLYKLGMGLFWIGIGWKAIQNLSVFVRKPYERFFNTYAVRARNFEKFTNHYCWIVIVLGLLILAYLYNKNPQILNRIKNELRQLFGWGKSNKYSEETVSVTVDTYTSDLVINARNQSQAAPIASNSSLLSDFATAIQKWAPRGAYYEYEYQDRLYRHLRKQLPDATVELEYPIGSSATGNKGRADIVVNDTILIEMKGPASDNAGSMQRAKGQIMQYSEIWQGKGPVILLLCSYDYDHAKLAFESTMNNLAQLRRPVYTIVTK